MLGVEKTNNERSATTFCTSADKVTTYIQKSNQSKRTPANIIVYRKDAVDDKIRLKAEKILEKASKEAKEKLINTVVTCESFMNPELVKARTQFKPKIEAKQLNRKIVKKKVTPKL